MATTPKTPRRLRSVDFNNDGRPDLFVVRFGHSQLYQNLGNGKFRNITKQAGLDRYMNAITAVAFDYDHDGYVDLFVGGYFKPVDIFKPDSPRFFPESFETANNGGESGALPQQRRWHIYGPHRAGGTEAKRMDAEPGARRRRQRWLGRIRYVACDFGTDRFFHNTGHGTFKDITESAIGIDTKKGMNARRFR